MKEMNLVAFGETNRDWSEALDEGKCGSECSIFMWLIIDAENKCTCASPFVQFGIAWGQP
jgi:hypothetical protein